MQHQSKKSDFLHLHFIVLLYGFTAILGKLITLSPELIVMWRTFLACIVLIGAILFLKIPNAITRKQFFILALIGALVALHWFLFFLAIDLSNVSVTLGCLASATLFTSLLDPIISGKRISWLEVLLGLITILGLYLITQFAFHYYLGIIASTSCALVAAIFTILNKRYVTEGINVYWIGVIEMGVAFILFAGISLYYNYEQLATMIPTANDFIFLLFLGVVCTAYAFVKVISILKNISAYYVTLAINLEPVYGILLAYLIFGKSELMSVGFYMGALIILISVLGYPYMRKKLRNRTNSKTNEEVDHSDSGLLTMREKE